MDTKENKNEKVIMEAKLSGGSEKKEQNVLKVSINEEQAAQNIAKSLVQDFITLVTIAGLKAVFAKFPDNDKFLNDLRDAWKKRNSVQLAEETKIFHNSILDAFSSEASVNEETTKKMNDQIESFNKTRDKSVEIAEAAVEAIVASLITKHEEKDQNNEKK